MKKQRSTRAALARFAQVATAGAALALLAACGGGSDDNNNSTPAGGIKLQVVSFGDSLSDVGTYSPVAAANFGGGRFTTNPGQVWTQNVAQYYGDTLTPAMTGGFGTAPATQSGLGYAQGGSRVTNPMGIGHAADPNSYAGALTVPVVTQVKNYLAAHGSFNSGQLVIVNGGANDILYNLQAVQAGAMSQADASAAIGLAAQQLGGVIATILQSGATHVLVSNVPDIGTTPQGMMSNAVTRAGLSAASNGFNNALDLTLQALNIKSKVIYLDIVPQLAKITANFGQYGFTVSNTGTACNLQAMAAAAQKYGEPDPQDFATSLFCSPQTLTVAGADQTYMYADTVHPTTHLHALYAQVAEQTVAATGLGK